MDSTIIYSDDKRYIYMPLIFHGKVSDLEAPSNLDCIMFGDWNIDNSSDSKIIFTTANTYMSLSTDLRTLTEHRIEFTTFKMRLESNKFWVYTSDKLQHEIPFKFYDFIIPTTVTHIIFTSLCGSINNINYPSSVISIACKAYPIRLDSSTKLPAQLKSITFPSNTFSTLYNVTLPETLTEIKFGDCYGNNLSEFKLPEGLISITLPGTYNRSIRDLCFPVSLNHIVFGDRYDRTLHDVDLPCSLVSMTFGCDFNRSLRRVRFPASFRSIVFGTKYTWSIHGIKFPPEMESITFGRLYNESLIDMDLPVGLKYIRLGDDYSESLVGAEFPLNLEIIKLGLYYSTSLDNFVLPKNLKIISFGGYKGQIHNIVFNHGLEQLYYAGTCNTLIGNLPLSLEIFSMYDTTVHQSNLPSSLKQIIFYSHSYKNNIEKMESMITKIPFGCELICDWHWC
ncbi:MAG: hypothetical protein Gaeavirus1_52 [Gaeavirus sp.]|uniref:F-box and FNIP repeat-containing protein n=1 Tax=Gaeavirus sp. TaxID=2487767 RepID=A0A3G4ZYC0_9VIRU|nr:MAG: hypothetical protein Gaeavirus1_52 [Gaeavirus sp.]